MQQISSSPVIGTRKRDTDRLSRVRAVVAMIVGLFIATVCFVLPAQAATPAAGTVIQNRATAVYVPAGYSQTESTGSNTVTATILAVESLTLTGEARVTRVPNVLATLNFLLTNTGNVASTYTLQLANGTGCVGADTLDLSGLRVVLDSNNNGVVDANEPALTGSASVSLAPGRVVSLLVQGRTPNASGGGACITLGATSGLQNVAATAATLVSLDPNPSLAITKTASYSGAIIAGSNVDFTIEALNLGVSTATPTATAAGTASTPLLVNGVPTSLVLLRDVLPLGTQYVLGSLRTATAGAVRLFRLPGDPPFSYRTTDDASAVEVAIGVSAIAPNTGIAMRFSTKVGTGVSADIVNQGVLFYNDSVGPAYANSNPVVLPVAPERIGIAKSAMQPVANNGSNGLPDGTATVRFSLLVRNYGTTPLFDVQVLDALEGSSATAFGSYTAQAVPAVGQYTIVPGSIAVQGRVGSSTVAAGASGYTGRAGAGSQLLASGAYLPVGGEFTVTMDVRVNLSGRTGNLLNTATALAARLQGGALAVTDDSVDGTDPDPDGDGNPNNNSSPTPVSATLAGLGIVKTAGVPRRLGGGVYEIDYLLSVTNNGVAAAPHVRVVDNLDCTFDMDLSTGNVAQWQLVGTPVARKGVLKISSNFTGRANCDRAAQSNPTGANVPTSAVLSLTDGNLSLAAGQSEAIAFTVRVQQKRAGERTVVTNTGWVSAFVANTLAPSQIVSAAAASVSSLLIDPQGVVYDSSTRQPVAGAVVKFTRQSCSTSSVAPITADQIFDGDSGQYAFAADGSVSMTTAADGQYQFYWKSPPIADLCDYGLSVTPPAGSGYGSPSAVIPAQAGTFASCGAVVSQATAPQGSESTTYYGVLRTGLNSSTKSACEAVHNHLPLDPASSRSGLLLRKEGNKTKAELGDSVDYALQLSNRTGSDLTGVTLNDVLPPGFAYVKGSTLLNGKPAPDPSGGSGPALTFSYPTHVLSNTEVLKVRYRLRIGVGAPTSGEAINRARANANGVLSNESSWKVTISGGVFSDEAYAVGKVHLDCNRNGEQDTDDELGIPGVRLYMEDGTSVITDAQGRWSLYGLKPVTHVIRLDRSTLPKGANLVPWDNRNAGVADSRFLDPKKGELVKGNFIVDNCEDAALVQAIKTRREAALLLDGSTTGSAVSTRLPTENIGATLGDTRALPASGMVSATGAATGSTVALAEPLIRLPAGLAGNGAGGSIQPLIPVAPLDAIGALPKPRPARSPDDTTGILGPLSAPSAADLELLVPTFDAKPGFVELKDGDTLPSRSVNVRVKGAMGNALLLRVNGQEISDKRVGKKSTLESSGVTAWEYIGVTLQPGVNTLQLQLQDDFGNLRGDVSIRVTAPDELGLLQFDLPADLRADPMQPQRIKLRLTDAKGVPVTARTAVTLEADRGRWLSDDLNPGEAGVQVFVEGGSVDLPFQPPAEPGPARLRATAGVLVSDATVSFLPALTPMAGIGIVEGVLDFSRRGAISLGTPSASNAFETELSGISRSSGDTTASARSAFYFKGTVSGDYLLTTAYDSDKTTRDRLFRDIRPDELYPVYGDNSVKGFDAQSTQKLYVRVDKNRSYLLFGDFTTASSPEVRELSQSNRSLTGIKHQYQDDRVRVTSYASRTSTVQQIEELPATGVSFYSLRLGSGDITDNSESIKLVVRDRNQPALVLSSTTLTRFTDYSFETSTRRIIFVNPISSIDANGNPQSIRVTYEVDNGGETFLVAGTDAQVRLGDSVQIGVVASKDENPANQRKLAAVTGLAKLGDNTVVTGEAVRTESDLLGAGNAARLSLRHEDERLKAQAQVLRTDTTFDNPSATSAAGHTELTARGEYKLDDTTRMRAEALYSTDKGAAAALDSLDAGAVSSSTTVAGSERRSVSIAVQKKLSEDIAAEVGLRHGNYSGTAAGGFDYGQVSSTGAAGVSGNIGSYGSVTSGTDPNAAQDSTTVRGRLTANVPYVPQAQVFGEVEQDVRETDRRAVAVGGTYALTDKTRIYGRKELSSSVAQTSSLGGTSQANATVLGIDSAYMEGGRAYNEYRLGNDAGTSQNATGIRNTFKISDKLRLTGGVEHTQSLNGGGTTGTGTVEGSSTKSTAIATGADYQDGPWRASGAVELRKSTQQDSSLVSAGVSYRLSDDWTVLARTTIIDTSSADGGGDLSSRQQLGFAWRPASDDRLNGLARYENRYHRVTAGSTGTATDLSSVSGTETLPGTYRTQIASALINYNPERGRVVTGRYALKLNTEEDAITRSSYWAQLVHMRYTQDIAPDWDIGVQGGLLFGKGGARQGTLGLEVGYQAVKNVWLSAGYNVLGLKDPDLAGADHTSRGLYLRLRFKFDETTLGFGSSVAAEDSSRSKLSLVSPPPQRATPGRPVDGSPAPAMPVGSRSMDWKPGQPLPGRIVWSESQLFVRGSAELTPAGTALVDGLATELSAGRIGEIDLSGGHGDLDAAHSDLWLARLANLRNLLRAKGPRAITIGFDTQALAPLPLSVTPEPGANRLLAIAVTGGVASSLAALGSDGLARQPQAAPSAQATQVPAAPPTALPTSTPTQDKTP